MKQTVRNRLFWAAAAALTGILFFCTVQTVSGHGQRGQLVEEKYYEEWEASYIREIRRVLEENGLENSGVTMTRVTQEDASRSYQVLIHHRRCALITPPQRSRLLEALDGLVFPGDGCEFSFCLSA